MTQPEALRLADLFDDSEAAKYYENKNVAAELRRLYEENQILIEALKKAAVLGDSMGNQVAHAALVKIGLAEDEKGWVEATK